MRNAKRFFIFLFLASIAANLLLIGCYFYFHTDSRLPVKNEGTFNNLEQQFPLLSKRTLFDLPQDTLINFLDLRKQIRVETEKYKDEIGLYFEYLPTGTNINVSSNTEYHAASLFKVPVVMAYYHFQERTGIKDKDTVIKYSELDNEFGDLWKKGAGYPIKLSEAVRLALEKSDNTAAKVVANNITDQDFAPVYNGLDIELEADNEGAIVTAKGYSSILKALYFASVINREDSHRILQYLANTPFNDKLAAPIPKNVTVAHKIGNFIDDDGVDVYNDCGIVYVPRRPYLLCMLSKSDEVVARERMQKLSKMVYDFVANAN